MVRYTFILFGLFAKPNLCPLTQNSGYATATTTMMTTIIIILFAHFNTSIHAIIKHTSKTKRHNIL